MLTPDREHQILQIDSSELGSISAVLASKKKISLVNTNGVIVNVAALVSSNAINAVLQYSFKKDLVGLEKISIQLTELFRKFDCKLTFQLTEDPKKKSTSYSFARDLYESKPREFTLDHLAGKVNARLAIRYPIPDLKSAIIEPQVLIDLFQILSKEFAAISRVLYPEAEFLKPEIFRCNQNLSAATLPESELTLELPAPKLSELVGQEHVITKLKTGLKRVERIFKPLLEIEEMPEGLRYKLPIIKSLLTVPEGYIFTGPSGVGKNFAVEGFVNELQNMLKSYRPKETLFVESISPNSIRAKWWGEDEKNVKELFVRLRKAVEVNGVAVLFVDEADTILGDANTSGHQSGITNQFKIELNQKKGIIVILNSNNPDRIDGSIRNRVGQMSELEFNYLNGSDVVRIIQNEFNRYRQVFSESSVAIDFNRLLEDPKIIALKDLSGRPVKQMLDQVFSKLAEQEIVLGMGNPPREIPGFLCIDAEYMKKLILKLRAA